MGYKIVFADKNDSDPPTNPIWTVDQIYGESTPASILPIVSGVLTNIAQLRQLSVLSFSTSYTVSGYTASGDGGGGQFVYNPTDTATADNGGTVIVDTIGRRWYRIYSGDPSIRYWGAMTTAGVNDSAAVQSAINWLNAQGGGCLYVPAGTCLVQNLQMYPNISWKGTGAIRYFGNTQTVSTMRQWTGSGAATDIVANAVVTGGVNSGYSASFVFTLASPTSGRSAMFRVLVSGGVVSGLVCIDPGSGFTSNQVVALIGGGGTTAVATFYASSCIISGVMANTNFWGINFLADNVSTRNSMGIVMAQTTGSYNWFDTVGIFSTWFQGIKQCGDPLGAVTNAELRVRNSFVECLVRTSGANFYAGAIEFWGTDALLSDNEVGAASSGDAANLYNAAVYVAGANANINHTIGEGADVGILITASGTTLGPGTHSEICFGHGIWLARFFAAFQPPTNCQIIGAKVINCGRFASNTYDGFHVQDSMSINGGRFTNLEVIGSAQRYDYYDGGSNVWDCCPGSGTAVTNWWGGGNAAPGPEQNCFSHTLVILAPAFSNTTTTGALAAQNVVPMPNTAGILPGMCAFDTTAAAITAGTTVASVIANVSITLSANVIGPGIGAGDTLTFTPQPTLGASDTFLCNHPVAAHYKNIVSSVPNQKFKIRSANGNLTYVHTGGPTNAAFFLRAASNVVATANQQNGFQMIGTTAGQPAYSENI